jgi:hypothetical protein
MNPLIDHCETCRYYRELLGYEEAEHDDAAHGECRRYAPRALTIPNGQAYKECDGEASALFPHVNPWVWCGEYQEK